MLPGYCLPGNLEDWRNPWRRPISPLEGEMSGRTEGGVDTPAVRLDHKELLGGFADHPPCFVPKSTFGVCSLSSSMVKLAKGWLLRNQKVAHSTEGKVFSVRL